MIRILLAILIATGLAACQPAHSRSGDKAARKAAPVPRIVTATPAPASYDWSFRTHGGSADLLFGDGDWAEGVALLSLSCLPAGGEVEASWGKAEPAILSAGPAAAMFQPDSPIATGHPVLVALRATGAVSLSVQGEHVALAGKAAGKAAVEAFFAYCTTPVSMDA